MEYRIRTWRNDSLVGYEHVSREDAGAAIHSFAKLVKAECKVAKQGHATVKIDDEHELFVMA